MAGFFFPRGIDEHYIAVHNTLLHFEPTLYKLGVARLASRASQWRTCNSICCDSSTHDNAHAKGIKKSFEEWYKNRLHKNKGVYDDNIKWEGVNHIEIYMVWYVFLVCLPSCPESEPKPSAVSALATSASFWTLESCRRQKARPHNSPATPEHTQHEHNYHSGFGIFFSFFFVLSLSFVLAFCIVFGFSFVLFFKKKDKRKLTSNCQRLSWWPK